MFVQLMEDGLRGVMGNAVFHVDRENKIERVHVQTQPPPQVELIVKVLPGKRWTATVDPARVCYVFVRNLNILKKNSYFIAKTMNLSKSLSLFVCLDIIFQLRNLKLPDLENMRRNGQF